jgi:6,7-dimethyl-8-ribityllumazine synthase
LSSAGSPGYAHIGESDASGLRVALVVSRFNADITDRLLEGARRALLEHGGHERDLSVVTVPGAWELPQTAARAVASGAYDAIVTLGCVIRGDTPHFDYVCTNASLGLGAVARDAGIPVVFGVLTTDDHAQALARAGDGPDNKGYECALSAVEMVTVLRALGAGR